MTIYACVACSMMVRVWRGTCPSCGATNGLRSCPKGTKIPRSKNDPTACTYLHKIKNPVAPRRGAPPSFGGDDASGFQVSDEIPGGDIPDGGFDDSGPFSAIARGGGSIDPNMLPEVEPIGEVDADQIPRIPTGIRQLDRSLGGDDATGYGAVIGSSNMVSGRPGIGKSTILLQALAGFAKRKKTLYLSGEERKSAIRRRINRLKTPDGKPLLSKSVRKNLLVVETRNTDEAIALIERHKPKVVIIDSAQVFESENATGGGGSKAQCKYLADNLLKDTCAAEDITSFVVSQVTKRGDASGSNVIAHDVDAHFEFDKPSKLKTDPRRHLTTKKNRNGSADVVGRFLMTSDGLRGSKAKKSKDAGVEPTTRRKKAT